MLLTPSLVCCAFPLLLSKVQAQTPTSVPQVPTQPTPTASPLPPISPMVADLLGELATAQIYASLFANGGDYQALCDAIVPENLSGIGGAGLGTVNGTGVKAEICTGASLVAQNADYGPFLTQGNQRALGYLATALFAVQVAGEFAGGPDLADLCAEIEEELINLFFLGFTNTDVGTQVKKFVCDAARASASTPVPACRTPPPAGNYGKYDYSSSYP